MCFLSPRPTIWGFMSDEIKGVKWVDFKMKSLRSATIHFCRPVLTGISLDMAV